ncbi:hypothetical protein GCM10027072_21150 [Streptomyces bullii]
MADVCRPPASAARPAPWGGGMTACCRREDGTTYELATGTQAVFWVCCSVTVLSPAGGLWRALRT